MSGTLYIKHFIDRDFVKAHPNALFAFGDNLAGRGLAGQAKEMRGEPNAVGIPTKFYPTVVEADYFHDDDLSKVYPFIEDAINILIYHLEDGGDVYWPSAGIGTGLADLPNKAPAIMEYIDIRFRDLQDAADVIQFV